MLEMLYLCSGKTVKAHHEADDQYGNKKVATYHKPPLPIVSFSN